MPEMPTDSANNKHLVSGGPNTNRKETQVHGKQEMSISGERSTKPKKTSPSEPSNIPAAISYRKSKKPRIDVNNEILVSAVRHARSKETIVHERKETVASGLTNAQPKESGVNEKRKILASGERYTKSRDTPAGIR